METRACSANGAQARAVLQQRLRSLIGLPLCLARRLCAVAHGPTRVPLAAPAVVVAGAVLACLVCNALARLLLCLCTGRPLSARRAHLYSMH